MDQRDRVRFYDGWVTRVSVEEWLLSEERLPHPADFDNYYLIRRSGEEVGAKAIVYSVTGSTPHHAYDAVEALLELKFTVRARTRNRTNGHRFKRYIESGQLIFDETAQDWQPDYSSVNSGLEGSPTTSSAVRFERSSALRKRAIQFHGLTCKICGFNFRQTYGDIGAGYIEVHHLQPLSEVGCEHEVNPRDDLIVLCSNCHRMIHRDGNPCLTLEELKSRMPEHNWYA